MKHYQKFDEHLPKHQQGPWLEGKTWSPWKQHFHSFPIQFRVLFALLVVAFFILIAVGLFKGNTPTTLHTSTDFNSPDLQERQSSMNIHNYFHQ